MGYHRLVDAIGRLLMEKTAGDSGLCRVSKSETDVSIRDCQPPHCHQGSRHVSAANHRQRGSAAGAARQRNCAGGHAAADQHGGIAMLPGKKARNSLFAQIVVNPGRTLA